MKSRRLQAQYTTVVKSNSNVMAGMKHTHAESGRETHIKLDYIVRCRDKRISLFHDCKYTKHLTHMPMGAKLTHFVKDTHANTYTDTDKKKHVYPKLYIELHQCIRK